MPNTFGNSRVQVELCDPRDARKYRMRFRRDAVKELAYANSIYVPCGRMPARGWILLTRADYDKVRGYGIDYALQIDSFDVPSLTFRNLSIVQARCVTTGVIDDPAAIYLVQLTDRRGVLANRWFQFPIDTYYNVLAPAYPSEYYTASLNAGSPWTWNGMIGDMWGQVSGYLGAYNGLAADPTGTPTNWNLPGVGLWHAMNEALDHIGQSVACDLTKDAATGLPYTIVSLGAEDSAFDALTALYAGRLEDDFNWLDVGAGRVPGFVTVYFRRVNKYYGTEETVRLDSLQWATDTSYAVTINAPAFFSGAVGTHTMRDDFCVRFDVDGNPLASDVVTANAIAAARVGQYFDLIYSRTSGYMDRTYSGALPFYAGSQVDGVCWKQSFDGDGPGKRAGWKTQIRRGELWPEIYG